MKINQPDFDFDVVVRARKNDPETSHEAASNFEADQTKAQRSIRTVVEILKSHGELTDFEIRDAWSSFWGSEKWSFTLPCKARHWARQAGLVKHVGFGTHQGRRVRKWGLGNDLNEPSLIKKCPTCGHVMRIKK